MNANAAERDFVASALAAGFSHAAALDPATLVLRAEVREMCASNRCKMYGACWTCPPACGTLEACGARIRAFSSGLLVQSVKSLADPFDYPGMLTAERRHQALFFRFQRQLADAVGELLALGAGGCRLCKTCTYPDAPCLHPDRAALSMEACGLLVVDVCRANGLLYRYGADTVCYTSCYLFSTRQQASRREVQHALL